MIYCEIKTMYCTDEFFLIYYILNKSIEFYPEVGQDNAEWNLTILLRVTQKLLLTWIKHNFLNILLLLLVEKKN